MRRVLDAAAAAVPAPHVKGRLRAFVHPGAIMRDCISAARGVARERRPRLHDIAHA